MTTLSKQLEDKLTAKSLVQDASHGVINAMRAIRKHKFMMLAITIFAIGATYFYSKSLPRVYDATSLVELSPNVARPLGEKSDTLMPLGTTSWDNVEYYETQYKLVTSLRVLSAVVRDQNLQSDYGFLDRKSPPPVPPSVDDVVRVLRQRTRVEPIKNSRLFILHLEDTDPKRAKRLCEAIATTYIDQNLEAAISQTSDAVVWLNGQMDHVKKDLDTSENALHAFKKDNDLPSTSINETSNMIRREMEEQLIELTKAKNRLEELRARYNKLASTPETAPDELPASELQANATLTELRKKYRDALSSRKELTSGPNPKGAGHPDVAAMDARILETKEALASEVRNVKGAVHRDLVAAEKEVQGKGGLYEGARKRAVDLTGKEIEYHRLDRSRDQNEKLYSLLLERTKETDLARMMRVNNIRLVDKPVEPTEPVRPNLTKNVSIGFVLGLLLGGFLAWLREQLDGSLKTPDDVEHILGVPVLGLLPEFDEHMTAATQSTSKNKRRRRRPEATLTFPELIVHERPLSGIAEAARSVRTNLMFMSPDKPFRSLLVTSAAPSEGKTTIACSIAIALAQGGQRVCIVDCDLRRPRLHRIFEREGNLGVTNFLVGDATIDEIAKPTQVENLYCIPSGPLPPNPADLLHSEKFKRFLHELTSRFDRVIVDSPPLIAVTDSAIVSTLVDGTVFVIRAFKTSRSLGQQGLKTIADVDSRVVGAVLNAVNFDKHEYNYYHYYYYKRDGYASLREEEPAMSQASAGPPN